MRYINLLNWLFHTSECKYSVKPRILFIIKKKQAYGQKGLISYGLLNSCQFIVNALLREKIEAKVVQVFDNSDIDKEVYLYKPTHVFLEALWVTPDKFPVLIKLHPKVKWFVRLHSKTPFLATEGIAIEWIRKYAAIRGLKVAANNLSLLEDIRVSLGIEGVYLPNIYLPLNSHGAAELKKCKDEIHLSCFGAIRPLKNSLIQALAAMTFANKLGKRLVFHINISRFENVGEAVLKNLEALFDCSGHKLVGHPWMDHDDFVKLVRVMDIGMQCSLSESCNIVAQDHVANDIPLVGSPEIEWLAKPYQANPNKGSDIVKKLIMAWKNKEDDTHILNKIKLQDYNKEAVKVWKEFLDI